MKKPDPQKPDPKVAIAAAAVIAARARRDDTLAALKQEADVRPFVGRNVAAARRLTETATEAAHVHVGPRLPAIGTALAAVGLGLAVRAWMQRRRTTDIETATIPDDES